MPVMAQVWRNEVVLRHGVVGQISRQLIIGPDVGYTFRRLWIQPIVDIVEVYKREMFNIEESKIKRTIVEYGATKVGLGVSPPGNTCILKKLHQMLVCEYLRLARLRIPEDAEVGPCFQPQIIRLAGMVARRIEILLGVRRCLQQCPVGVRG